MSARVGVICSIAMVLLAAAPTHAADTTAAASPPLMIGRAIFDDARNPPAYRTLTPEEQERFDLGHAVFNTQFVAPDTANAGRRSGLGPLYNASACDECHNEGAHGRGPLGEGIAPAALVMELQRTAGAQRSDEGDPHYGHVLNTQSVPGVSAEGMVVVHFQERAGHFADGARWSLRVPRYELRGLHYGAIDPQTILAPRIAPALFGLGLLEAVPQDAVATQGAASSTGRFNWQANAGSVAEQTARAMAREMGLTTRLLRADDCTPVQSACLAAGAHPAPPEVQEPLLQALLGFEHWLAVPAPLPSGDAEPSAGGSRLFFALGCGGCHRPSLPVVLEAGLDGRGEQAIAAFTDLQLHDLGTPLADRTVTGRPMRSRWRTAPLWGLGYRLRHPIAQTFLHDGRARSVEEAILWHGGEAQRSHDSYLHLTCAQREQLLQFLASL